MNEQVNPDDKMQELILQEFGGDPLHAILAARKGPTPPPPGPEITSAATTAQPQEQDNNLRPATQEEIKREAALVSVNEQGTIDWSRNAATIGDCFDRLNTGIFSLLANATPEQREDFAMEERDMDSFINAMEPVAKKHNWQVGPEYALAIVVVDILQRNFRHAISLRKANKQMQALQEENEMLKAQQAARAQMKVAKEETAE